jgi:hypothetical protein
LVAAPGQQQRGLIAEVLFARERVGRAGRQGELALGLIQPSLQGDFLIHVVGVIGQVQVAQRPTRFAEAGHLLGA